MGMKNVTIHAKDPKNVEKIRKFFESIMPEEHHEYFTDIYFAKEIDHYKLKGLTYAMALPNKKLLVQPWYEEQIVNPKSQRDIDGTASTILHEYGHYAFYHLSGKRAGDWHKWVDEEYEPKQDGYLKKAYGDRVYMEYFADGYMRANHPNKEYRGLYVKNSSELIDKYKEFKSGAWTWTSDTVVTEWEDKEPIEDFEHRFINSMPIKATRKIGDKTFLLIAGHLDKEEAERWSKIEKGKYGKRDSNVRVVSYNENGETKYAIFKWNRWLGGTIDSIPKKFLKRKRAKNRSMRTI